MEKIVAYLDFHGCLLRGAGPNRVLNRYDRKRERDRGQSAFCVPINHFSPPPYPMRRSPSCWTKPFPDPRSPAPYGSTTRVPASRNAGPAHPRAVRRSLVPPPNPVREHRRAETAPAVVERGEDYGDRRHDLARKL